MLHVAAQTRHDIAGAPIISCDRAASMIAASVMTEASLPPNSSWIADMPSQPTFGKGVMKSLGGSPPFAVSRQQFAVVEAPARSLGPLFADVLVLHGVG